jgi:hypothetical protein
MMTVRRNTVNTLTPGANIGTRTLWLTTHPTKGTFTIHMSSSRTTATKVSWLLLG